MPTIVLVPLKTINPLNKREHYLARARRVKREKQVVLVALLASGVSRPRLPLAITLTRVSPRSMDSDGAIAALKGVRDEVAAWIGVDDRDTPSLVWRYAQRKGKVGVEIIFEPGVVAA